MKRLALAGALTLAFFGPAAAENYLEPTGNVAVKPFVPMIGCANTLHCVGPVSNANPMPVNIVGGGGGGGGGSVTATPTGTAGTPNASVVTVQGITNGTPLITSLLSLPAFAATPTFNLGTLNGAALAANQTNGSQKTQIVDGAGNVIGSTSNNLNVQCANCSGSGVSTGDNATFTSGSSLFAADGGVYQSTPTSNPLTDGHQGMAGLTHYRARMSALYNSSGVEVGTSAAPVRIDPTGITPQPASQSGTWSVGLTGGNIGNTAFGVSGTLPNFANPPTVNLGTLGGGSTAAAQTSVESSPGTSAGTAVTIQGSASGVPVTVQGTLSASIGGFTPNGAYGSSQNVTTTSSPNALPTASPTVAIYNKGLVPAYVKLGTTSGVTATTANDQVAAGGFLSLVVGSNTYIAAITASGTTTLNTSGGAGLLTGSGGGVSGSGSSGAVTLNTSPSLANGNGVVQTQNGSALSNTNGEYANLLQGNAVLSTSNPLFAQLTTGSLTGITGTLPAFAATPTVNLGTIGGTATAANQANVESAVGTSAATAITIQGSASGVALPVTVSNTNNNGQAAMAGSAPVTIASDQSAVKVQGGAAVGSAPSGNPNLVGALGGGATGGLVNSLLQADTSVPINISTATTTQIVGLVSGRKIYVMSFNLIAGGTGNITFEYGTGSNCGTGTTALTGPYPMAAQGGMSTGGGLGPVLVVPAGNALCALTSAAIQISGSLSEAQN